MYREIVRHRNLEDCSVCAVATACNISWETSLERMSRHKNHIVFRSYTRDMVEAVNKDKTFCTDFTRLKTLRSRLWSDIPIPLDGCALVKVRYPSQKANWHTVVWDGYFVYESNAEIPLRPEWYGLQPLAYLIVKLRR